MNSAQSKERPLEGIRVLDFGRILAAPHCALLLRDLGADVIKIERPVYGDDSRSDPYVYEPGLSAAFMQQNWGKKSVSVDLRTEQGKDIIRALVRKSDIVIENFRPGVMAKLGFSYDALAKINPRIIMCSISAYGQTGPYAQRAGYGSIAESVAAIPEVTGDPKGPPMPTVLPIADNMAAGLALSAICAVLYWRERSGRGQYIDIALLDAAFQMHDIAVEQFLASNGKVRMTREGIRSVTWVPAGLFKGKDGWVQILTGNEFIWPSLAKAMGRPDLVEHPDFATFERRFEHRETMYKLMEEWVESFDSIDQIVELLGAAGVPCDRVNTVEQAINHPQLRARQMLVERIHPTMGPMLVMNSGINLSDLAADVSGTPPFLGEHNREVLETLLGMDASTIDRLTAEGVLYQDPRLTAIPN
jgi:CoA:oxalate CoA-transferase